MIRIFLWVIFLALIGGFLAGKSAVIETSEIAKGMIMGGAIGLVIGVCFHKLKKPKPESTSNQ